MVQAACLSANTSAEQELVDIIFAVRIIQRPVKIQVRVRLLRTISKARKAAKAPVILQPMLPHGRNR